MNSIIIISLITIIVSYTWYVVIVSRRNKTFEALSGIDVQLNKRHDLIPNILKIARRFMEHEKELLSEITELRTQAQEKVGVTDAKSIKEHLSMEQALQGKMGQLFVAVENYPDLKSDETMLQAQRTYNEVEEHIAAARRFYNASVTSLQNAIQIFPGNLLATLAGAKEMPFYEADEAVNSSINADDFMK